MLGQQVQVVAEVLVQQVRVQVEVLGQKVQVEVLFPKVGCQVLPGTMGLPR